RRVDLGERRPPGDAVGGKGGGDARDLAPHRARGGGGGAGAEGGTLGGGVPLGEGLGGGGAVDGWPPGRPPSASRREEAPLDERDAQGAEVVGRAGLEQAPRAPVARGRRRPSLDPDRRLRSEAVERHPAVERGGADARQAGDPLEQALMESEPAIAIDV